MTLEEINESDIHKVMEYTYRFLEEQDKEDKQQNRKVVGEISPDDAFSMF